MLLLFVSWHSNLSILYSTLYLYKHVTAQQTPHDIAIGLYLYAFKFWVSQLYDIVACLLKARNVKPAETAFARERLCKHPFRGISRHVT
jgi:hypothetical protein